MGRQNMLDLISVIVQFIIDVQNCSAGVAKNCINALLQQTFHQNLRACHLHDVISSLNNDC